VKAAALCAGYGGLELGLALAGWDVELAWVSEVDLHASKVLDARFAVPNLGDLTTITDPPPVDVVTAGFPCQPVSTAGKRKGTADARWLIDDVCDLARRAGVRWLVLENVPGLLTANDGDAMARVCSALAHNGFDAEWTHLRAADVGAPHGRLRWFCVAGLADGGDGDSLGSRNSTARRRPDSTGNPGDTLLDAAWKITGLAASDPMSKLCADGNTSSDDPPPTPPTGGDSTPDSSSG
jgi:DNA (cytosine-5)-methyltransferase 1